MMSGLVAKLNVTEHKSQDSKTVVPSSNISQRRRMRKTRRKAAARARLLKISRPRTRVVSRTRRRMRKTLKKAAARARLWARRRVTSKARRRRRPRRPV